MSWRKNYNIRPIQDNDLLPMLNWRNSTHIRSNMFTNHIISLEEHEAWFQSVLNNKWDRIVYIFEYCNHASGVVQFTLQEGVFKEYFWGFYLGRQGLPHGTGTIMLFLALELFFEDFDAYKIWGDVLDFNLKSLKVHQRLGFFEVKWETSSQGLKTKESKMFTLTKESWKQQVKGIEATLNYNYARER